MGLAELKRVLFFVLSLLFFLKVDHRESAIGNVLSLVPSCNAGDHRAGGRVSEQGSIWLRILWGFKTGWQEAFVIFVVNFCVK